LEIGAVVAKKQAMTFHEFVKDEGGWAIKQRVPLFVHQYLEVDQVQLCSPTRSEPFEWTVCHRKAGVVVAAQTPDGGFVMVRQERVPVRCSLWEFPAGQIDASGIHEWETILSTALRELSEEAGYVPASDAEVVPMHHFLSSPGFTDEHCYQIWIKGVTPGPDGMHLDPNEAITEVRVFSWEALQEMVVSGEIRDANTLCCLARLGALRALKQA
jgi:ADP-ribose pyrophosphatase